MESPHCGSATISGEIEEIIANLYDFDETVTEKRTFNITWNDYCVESEDVVLNGTSIYTYERESKPNENLWYWYSKSINGNIDFVQTSPSAIADTYTVEVTNTGGATAALAGKEVVNSYIISTADGIVEFDNNASFNSSW